MPETTPTTPDNLTRGDRLELQGYLDWLDTQHRERERWILMRDLVRVMRTRLPADRRPLLVELVAEFPMPAEPAADPAGAATAMLLAMLLDDAGCTWYGAPADAAFAF